MNKVILAGRLVADPESIITKNGTTMCRISVACNDASGRKDEVYFFPCLAWEAKAKFISTYLKKGSPVIIDGRLQRRSYVNAEGNTVYNTEVLIDTIRSFGSSNSNQQGYVPSSRINSNTFNSKNDIEIEKNLDQLEKSTNLNQPNFQDDIKDENSVIEDFDLDWLDQIED